MSPAEETLIPEMDATDLYREDTYTDHKVGTIRVMTPVTAEGDADPGRAVLYTGQTQLLTPMGALPINFDIEAGSLAEATGRFAAAANEAVEKAMKELQELRREAASSIIVPEGGGMGGPGGVPGGGKIQLR
jgi:hypothetical protein